MNKRHFLALIATLFITLGACAQSNAYKMVLTLTDGTVVTIGPNDLQNIEFIEGNITATGENITDLMNQMKVMKANIADLTAMVYASQDQITALNAKVDISQTNIETLTASVAKSQNDIAALAKSSQNDINALQKGMVNMQETVDANEVKAKNYTDKATVDLKQYTNDAIVAAIAQLENEMYEVNEVLRVEILELLGALEARVQALEE